MSDREGACARLSCMLRELKQQQLSARSSPRADVLLQLGRGCVLTLMFCGWVLLVPHSWFVTYTAAQST